VARVTESVRSIGDGWTAKRRKVEAQLRRSEEQLRALSGHLLEVQEEERARIAREIHDGLGQGLAALKMDLAWLGQRLPETDDDLQRKVRTMECLVDGMVRAVRRIASGLRPGVLDDLGLVAALEWQSQEFHSRTGLACDLVTVLDDITLDSDRATAVFRVFQEALANVLRHARATRVNILLTTMGDRLVLEVRDDGKGIPAHAITDPRSLGLIGMRERVLPWGGEVRVMGARGQGTVVSITLPVGNGGSVLPGASA